MLTEYNLAYPERCNAKLEVYIRWWVCNTINERAFEMMVRGSKDTRDHTRAPDCSEEARAE